MKWKYISIQTCFIHHKGILWQVGQDDRWTKCLNPHRLSLHSRTASVFPRLSKSPLRLDREDFACRLPRRWWMNRRAVTPELFSSACLRGLTFVYPYLHSEVPHTAPAAPAARPQASTSHAPHEMLGRCDSLILQQVLLLVYWVCNKNVNFFAELY